MTYRIAIWRLCFSRTLFLARAAAKASSWNGFGLSVDFARPLQVLVRVWGTCAMACPMARWHVKLRQEGATPWASGALAANNWLYAPLSVLIGYPPKITATRTAIVPAMPIINLFRFLTFCRRVDFSMKNSSDWF